MKASSNFQKFMLICTAMLTTMPAYAISAAGAAAATAGALIGAAIIGTAISIHHKHKEEERNECDDCREKKRQRKEEAEHNQKTKFDLKDDLTQAKKDRQQAKSKLEKSRRSDKVLAKKNKTNVIDSAATKELEFKVNELEKLIKSLKNRIDNL